MSEFFEDFEEPEGAEGGGDFEGRIGAASKQISAASKVISRFANSEIEGSEPGQAGGEQLLGLFCALRAAVAEIRQAQKLAESALLSWFAEDPKERRELFRGEEKFWPEREKSLSLPDFPEAFQDLLRERALETALEVALGDEEAALLLLTRIGNALVPLLSTSALKQGACKDSLGQEFFDRHWVVTWGDKLKAGEPAKKLGVGNERFQKAHDRAGGRAP